MLTETLHIAVIGLDHVGLPLAVERGKEFDTLGFDMNAPQFVELLSLRIYPGSLGSMALATATLQRQ